MVRSYFVFYFLIFLAFLSGCGQDSVSLDPQVSRVGETLIIAQRTLSDQEKSVALKICDSFRAKWTEFRISKLDTPFNFTFKKTSCSAEVELIDPLPTTLKRVLDSQPLIYDTAVMEDTMLFMESHIHGHLAQTCQALQSGRDAHIFETKNGKRHLFSFNSRGNLSDFTVFIANQEQNNSFLVEEQASYSVLTNPQQGQQEYKGMVVNSLRQKRCAAGTSQKAALYEQTFIFP